MKNALFGFLAVALLTVQVQAADKYCRSVKLEGGFFGQPAGVREHCVIFDGGKMNDNANTFFGNPPETTDFVINGGIIYRVKNGKSTPAYRIIDANHIGNDAGAILMKK